MKPHICLCSTLCAFVILSLTGIPVAAKEPATAKSAELTYIIPIKGPIGRGLLYAFRRGMKYARSENATAIVIHMDTPGGMVLATQEIIRSLLDLPDDVRTYVFIDKDALSAGAMISLATHEIHMAPGARVGASAIIMGMKDIPEGDMREKIFSATAALVRDAAQRRGHDPAIVDALMRKEFEYVIGQEVICPAGQLLTLTTTEAIRVVGDGDDMRPLLAVGTADDLDAFLASIGRSQTRLETLEITTFEKLARWIEAFSAVFLTIGMLGIYIEFKTPGFGIPGFVGILCLSIFFWGHNVAGLAGTGELLIFLTGVILLLIEIFVVPGFGIIGIGGISLILLSLAMAMVEHIPGGSWFEFPGDQIQHAVLMLSISLVSTIVLATLLARYLPKTHVFQALMLSDKISAAKGYTASSCTDNLLGKQGVAYTPLHPAGIGEFGDQRFDVIARGSFINEGTPIVVAETHGNRIVVDTIDNNQAATA